MRIDLPSGAWVECKDNMAPMDRYAVRDAPDTARDDNGDLIIVNAAGNMWREFLARVITAWSWPDPVPSADQAVLNRVPELEEDQEELERVLRPRYERIAGTSRRGNRPRPPAATSGTPSAS
jgi:hypothetical protein